MSYLLALDIGEKRIGIAKSDDSKQFVFPCETIKTNEADKLKEMICDPAVEKVIIGLPRNMDGSLGSQAEKVKDYVASNLEQYGKPIEYEDESATSVAAAVEMKNQGLDPNKDKVLIDAYAAKIILESYLRRD